MNNLTTTIIFVIILFSFSRLIEKFATSPATLTQLATSSTTTLPFYGGGGWNYHGGAYAGYCPNARFSYGWGAGRPFGPFGGYSTTVRPVMQRGVYFYNPSWTRL